MNRLLMFVGTTIGGYVGWSIGEWVGLGFMGAFLLSSVGSLAGIYAAWRLLTDYLS